MRLFSVNPSGGLSYHLLAWKRSGNAWESYRQSLEKWILARHFHGKSLLIIGPSGGYTLGSGIFRNFETVAALDMDPWARFFFRKAHREAKIQWHAGDFFEALSKSGGSIRHIYAELGLPRETVLFFANVLGQVEFLRSDYADVLASLGKSLREVEWVSVHDRLCTRLLPRDESVSIPELKIREKSSDALVERYFTMPSGGPGVPEEVEEHDLDALWSGAGLEEKAGSIAARAGEARASWAYLPWRIRRNWTHLVEAVHCLPSHAPLRER